MHCVHSNRSFLANLRNYGQLRNYYDDVITVISMEDILTLSQWAFLFKKMFKEYQNIFTVCFRCMF